MKEKELRRSMAVFPIGAVMTLTDLSARQIRYYEDQELIKPERTEGNRRLFSLNDMDRLLEIKDFLDEGLNIAAIKREYAERQDKLMQKQKVLTDADVRRILHDELLNQGGFSTLSQHIGNFRI
ncbi:TPA: MerR family transcriptional regulator [Streptococcus equi subsp. zooepidemicus]|nr:MerR family transcriptional regulator [Streptococcus equi subsp. zooepidemicus]HEL1244849.1 MerR family transcriptional regulator [Streptococcus equi subsp. zooepidemicus]